MCRAPEILVFYPEDGVSPMQKRQMVTQEGANVAVCAIEGNFDDAQTGVKRIFYRSQASRAKLAEHGYVLLQRQLHQLGPAAAPDRLLCLRLPASWSGSGEDHAWASQMNVVRAHRQLRQHSGRLLRKAAWACPSAS